MIRAEIQQLESNDHIEWSDFVIYEPTDPLNDYGWFHVRIAATGQSGSNDFQLCVSTPRAVGLAKRAGSVPGILVDHFDADTIRDAIHHRVTSITGHTWEEIVEQLRAFMLWEYEGMSDK